MNTRKIRIGITGQAGFVGTHLFNTIGLRAKQFEAVPFEDDYFSSTFALQEFVKKCDVIVHLAAVNRSNDPDELYTTNVQLVEKLIAAMEAEQVTPFVVFTSSIQEKLDNPYGRSKVKGREIFEAWAKRNSASFVGLIVPNVFGPFCKPNYNSFIATFSWRLTHNELPEIINDSKVQLIYINSLCTYILQVIEDRINTHGCYQIEVPYDIERTVSSVLDSLKNYKDLYFVNGIIPVLSDSNDVALFNTFRSYIDIESFFPRKLKVNSDDRGTFVETIRLGIGGQVSFSTTFPGITRGNHYHTRKIERFTVIKGKALIALRKIGTNQVYSFELNGEEPAYVDMPIWYTHNITNIGSDELYTQFWINEWYDEANPDTYFEKV